MMFSTNGATDAFILTTAVAIAYIAFYTAYDKTSKTLKSSQLLDFFLLRRGLDWTLVEINKALSLTAITTLLLSFSQYFIEIRKNLLYISIVLLIIHAVYSSYKFYDFQLMKLLKDKNIKKLSIVLGSLGQYIVMLGYLEMIPFKALLFLGTILSLGHFWTMEVDFKYVLQVRPFAYLPFVIGLAILVHALVM